MQRKIVIIIIIVTIATIRRVEAAIFECKLVCYLEQQYLVIMMIMMA